MKGFDETVASMLLTGLSTGPESVPVIVNLTTGDGLVFFGNVPQGHRLWLQAHDDGGVTARLERTDVTSQLRSLTGLVPGTVWNASQLHSPPRALPLRRGTNELWFFTAAHFDALRLNSFLLEIRDLRAEAGAIGRDAVQSCALLPGPGGAAAHDVGGNGAREHSGSPARSARPSDALPHRGAPRTTGSNSPQASVLASHGCAPQGCATKCSRSRSARHRRQRSF